MSVSTVTRNQETAIAQATLLHHARMLIQDIANDADCPAFNEEPLRIIAKQIQIIENEIVGSYLVRKGRNGRESA